MSFGQNFPVVFGGIMMLTLTIFTSCTNGENVPLSEEHKEEYLSKGKEITAATFAALSSSLTQAMKESGPTGAIGYCQLQALPLTDSLSRAFNATIKRTSDKLRNPANRPAEWELEVIRDYQKLMENGQEPKPRVFTVEDKVVFTAPIRVLPQCLVCHGQPEQDIAPETLQTLAERYPEDAAKGYKAGELRGIWSVSFNQK
ncbi:MAG: hypothetical protein CMN32_00760 [Saprospirales bacterium]|nr:hypothetical protein [Saprospirales bacterium]